MGILFRYNGCMRSFHWTIGKSVFVPELDAEHRNLYELAAEVQASVDAGAPPPVYTPGVRTLLASAADHFAHEERLMRRAHYPLLKWHTSQHDAVRTRAAACLKLLEAGDAEAGGELLEFLSRWLGDHLAVADRMMAAALRAHARQRAA